MGCAILVHALEADVRAFRERDWSAFERAPVALEPGRSTELAGSLYDQVRAANPDWPTADDRAEDIEDVVGILRAGPDGLDVDAVRSLLSELEQLLGQSDLVEPFEAALRRARVR